MKLSIITINRNNAEGLKRTLDSVKSQICQEFEHIIVDGASTDDSVKVIESYVRDVSCMKYDVLWVSEPDMGIYNAMNKGIRKATGDYVYILNSGDELAVPDVVERMMEALARVNSEELIVKIGGVPILMGNIVHVYGDGRKVRERKRVATHDINLQPIDASMLTFYKGTIPHDAAFVRRDLFEKYGYFDETMKICADWKLYLDMIALGGIVPMYIDIDVVLFDMSGVSNTNNARRLAERRAYLEKILHPSILKDYDRYSGDIMLMQRLHRHSWAYRLTWFLERILFKIEKLKKC